MNFLNSGDKSSNVLKKSFEYKKIIKYERNLSVPQQCTYNIIMYSLLVDETL